MDIFYSVLRRTERWGNGFVGNKKISLGARRSFFKRDVFLRQAVKGTPVDMFVVLLSPTDTMARYRGIILDPMVSRHGPEKGRPTI